LDAEYYRPSHLNYEKLLRNKKAVPLSTLANFMIGPFGSAFTVDNYVDIPDYRYIRGKDVKRMRILDSDNVYMPKSDYERLSKYALKENDILVSVVATIGNSALVTKKDLPAIFSCKSSVIRTKSINPKYLVVYLNSRFGCELLKRKERGAIQKGLNLDDLKVLDIYVPDNSFQNQIEKLYDQSIEKIEKSKSKYQEAEELLLKEVGLDNFESDESAINVKNFKGSFLSSGRLDAEFYQPKYEKYLEKIQKHTNSHGLLKDICNKYDKNFTPIDDQKYKYIELSNTGKTGFISDYTYADGIELPTRARRLVKEGNVLVSSIEGSLDSCAIIGKEHDNSICSTGFFVIDSDIINSETLVVLFKSEIMQQVLKQYCSGTILSSINKDEFNRIPLPIICSKTQEKIATKLKESFKLRSESEVLLEKAKSMVEYVVVN